MKRKLHKVSFECKISPSSTLGDQQYEVHVIINKTSSVIAFVDTPFAGEYMIMQLKQIYKAGYENGIIRNAS